MKIHSVASYFENFVPKKVLERSIIRKNRLEKQYAMDLAFLQKIVLDLNWTYNIKNSQFLTQRQLKNKEYVHTIGSDTLYFMTHEHQVEIPLEIINWKIWVDRLIEIGLDDDGLLNGNFESFEAHEESLKDALFWVSWYFGVPKKEVNRYYDTSL